MTIGITFLYLLIFLLAVLVFLYLLKRLIRFYSEQKKLERKDMSQVHFVVDTFHELVSKLKEKENELEVMRQKAEDRAMIIEGYNENILQSVPSGVMSFDEEMRITKVNIAAEKILDIKGEIIIGKYHTDVFNKPITDLLDERKVIERGEINYTTQSGKKIWLGLTLSPLKDREGRRIGQILIFTDLTHLKAFEAQMELRARLSSLGEISAGIAHEMRNPMGVIAGYTKLLTKKVDSSLKHTVDAISKEISVMDRIISDFLSFAKPTELMISDLDLKMIIENCVSVIAGERKDIHARLDIERLPLLKGDEVLLRQAFTNLIQNAVEAMPAGGELAIKAFPSISPEGNFIEMMMTDTGHGIAENIIDKVFFPFFTTKEKGTGLGLAIVHKIIVSHGGNIFVESSEKGTTFRIKLPQNLSG
ncbi:MAG: ATP-binding protein [Nitrospirota bacterium]|nr:ATP-binding protein [Nitrospirota bacterium]MDH5767466.1 ATP-binding protein [Nitrospirota bacterium]